MDFLSSMLWPEASSYADNDDEQNPAVLDFPLTLGDEKKKAKKSPKQTDDKHPYPVSISIQMNGEPSGSPDHEQRRSPTASPGDRGKKSSSKKVKETRQPNSPIRNNNTEDHKDERSSELQKYHEQGRKQFLCNHLAEAVDSYTQAIRTGLEEMTHRKEMMDRMESTHQDKDIFTLESGESVAQVHLDLALALEIAGNYAESAEELSNGRGMLKHTCHKKKDHRIRECMKNIERMERAVAVDDERKKQRSKMESALKKVEGCPSKEEKESARKKAIGAIKQLLRIERDSLGEQSYAVAKLKLKIAKVRYEGNDLEGALQDADAAVKTLRHVLGAKHTLVGCASLFAATVYEKLVSILSSTELTDPKPISTGMTQQCKSKIKRALELYAEALEPLKLKYSGGDKMMEVQPELGDVYHRIGRLYGKEGSYVAAVDAYQSSLEAYGAAAVRKTEEFCPDAVTVWHNMGELHLVMNKYHDAVYAARKCAELAKMIPKSSSSDESIVVMLISSFQVAGDAYAAMNRHDDATKSYQEALNAFRNARSKSRVKKNFSSMEEAKILKKIGNSLLHEDKTSEAKANLLDALKCLRSDKKGANGPELPMLLSNIGHAHIRCGEYIEAIKVLRSCLKCYSDQGVSDRSPEVARAKQLYKEAQRGPDHHPESPDEAYTSSQSPQRTITTNSTVPSTVYSSTISSGVYSGPTLSSIHGQLQSLLEQLQLTRGSNTQSPMSPGNSHKSPNGNHHPPNAEINPSELQLDQVETLIKRLQAKVQPSECEPDLQEKKRERMLATVDRRIACEDASKSAEHIATLEAELKSLRKELEASESSYRHMLEVVDETKENMKVTHEIEKKSLEREIMSLRQQQKEAAANGILTNKFSEEITVLRQEIHRLKEQNKNSSEEVALLKSTNRTLEVGNDAAMSKIDSLNETIEKLKNEAHRTSSGNAAEMKKLEYELKQERSRRMILEASIEKDYDNRQGGGGFAYHPMMPFGYPMQVGPDKNLKTLEIDLATERANKEMLEGIVKDLTATHEQEVNELSVQLRDMPNLVLQLEAHKKQNAALSKQLSETKLERETVQEQLDDALNELSDVKGRFLQTSCELSSLLEEKSAISDAYNEDRDALEFTKKKLAETLTALTNAQSELKAEVEVSRINSAEKEKLHEEHDCLKKEFKEAIAVFHSEIEEARRMKNESETSYGKEIDRIKSEQAEFFSTKNKELDDTRLHLKNVLAELEEAEDSRDTFQTEVQKLEMILEITRHELEVNTEELLKATEEVEALRAGYEEAESARTKLEESQAQHQTDQDKKIYELESSLCMAEKTIKELEDVQSRLSGETETTKKQIKSALQVLKKISTAFEIEVEDSLSDDDDALLHVISSNIESAVEAKNKELQVAAWNLSNTINELDVLEKKHQQLKDELTEISDLRAEHNELLQECKQLSKDLFEANVEKEEAQERCDLHKSRLKDAVDDLEELEYERDDLKEELDRAFDDCASLERSLRDMIGALEDENERLKKYESATVDFDAAVWEKDQKLKQLKEELHAAHSQLTILRASVTRNSKESVEEIYPDILPDTQNALEEMASLRSLVHSLEERNLELSEKLAKREYQLDADMSNEQTGYDGSEVKTLKLRVRELSELNENLEEELSKMKTYVDEVEMQRESDEMQEDVAALNGQVNELAQQLQESQEEVMKAANTHDNDVEAIASLQDALANKDKQYMDELATLEEQVASLREVNSSLEDRLASTVRISEGKEVEQFKSSSEDVMREDILSLKAQIRDLEQENDRLSALLAESQAETIDASRTHADDQETIFKLRNALEEKNELLQSSQQETPDDKDGAHQAELNQWISRVDALENELGELKNQETRCDECDQRNLQLANVMESLNDLQIENQGLKTEILLWETADDGGKGVGQKVNFEKEMNAAHKRFVSMEKSLQESIKRLEKEKEKLVAAHHDELSRKTEQHDKTRIELSAWKLEMQNALNDIESLKRENDDLRSSFDAVSHAKTNSS
jgi:chromosome segregation ATPase